MSKLKNNAVYYYDKVRGDWCTHGIVFTVIIDGIMYAVDTYGKQDIEKHKELKYFGEFDKVWKAKDIESDLEYIMDIDDIKEVNERTFDLWSDKDKVHIPIGNWHERYLVNKNKGIDRENETYKLRSEIESLKWTIESKKRELESKECRLKEIESEDK
ncbi:hypothetical protein FDB40_06420 [Clostridium botulinum]|nr:hypothetical protein [Clostridium botulinum]